MLVRHECCSGRGRRQCFAGCDQRVPKQPTNQPASQPTPTHLSTMFLSTAEPMLCGVWCATCTCNSTRYSTLRLPKPDDNRCSLALTRRSGSSPFPPPPVVVLVAWYICGGSSDRQRSSNFCHSACTACRRFRRGRVCGQLGSGDVGVSARFGECETTRGLGTRRCVQSVRKGTEVVAEG
jgi:hypothetical protein